MGIERKRRVGCGGRLREIGYCKGERGQDLEMGRERVGKGKEGRGGEKG